VAGEIRDGKVRVELAVNAASRSRIPFQHGLPGSVEVEVERTSPAVLLLRSAGEAVGAH
jgi:membrane fusion protein (multidrug efflux system)